MKNGGDLLKQWGERIALITVVVGGIGYLQNDRAKQEATRAEIIASFEGLEDELRSLGEAERIRDDEWEHDDELRVAEQDRILQAVRVTQDQITSELASQTANLTQLVGDGDERFLQRENRFEELETENKLILEAIRIGQNEINYRLGIITGFLEINDSIR